MTAVLFVEAIDTAGVLLDAILAWIVVAAVVVTVVVFTAVLTGAWAWRRARRGLSRRLRPEVPTDGPRLLPAPERPAGARSANRDRQEAA